MGGALSTFLALGHDPLWIKKFSLVQNPNPMDLKKFEKPSNIFEIMAVPWTHVHYICEWFSYFCFLIEEPFFNVKNLGDNFMRFEISHEPFFPVNKRCNQKHSPPALKGKWNNVFQKE